MIEVIKTLVIAPYPGLAALIKQLDEQLTEFDITVEQGDLTRSLELLEKYKHDNFDLIISRGGTANLIREHTTIPVLNMQISGYDILRILTLLKGYQSTTIGMIGFKDVIKSFESVSNLMDIDINYIEVQHENEVTKNLIQAKKHGIRVIVGDTITIRLANKIGLQGVLITSGKESVLKTFEDAKQLYNELSQSKSQRKTYETLFDNLDEGIIVIDKAGHIKFANQIFLEKLNIQSHTHDKQSIFRNLPFLKTIIHFKELNDTVVFQLSVNNFDEIYEIKHHRVMDPDGESLYAIRFTPSSFTKDTVSLQVIFSYKAKEDAPQFITSGTLFENSMALAKRRLSQQLPVSIIGEEGTGRRILTQTLTEHEANTIEIRTNNISTRLFNQLMTFLEQVDSKMIIHIRDVNKMTQAQQVRLLDKINTGKYQFVISFTGDECALKKNNLKLHKDLHLLLSEEYIFLPTLREIKSDLEGFIQTFIIQFNEQFGKQVVGLKSNVLQHFLSHPWYGNLIELREVLRQVVKQSSEEYINEDALPILKQYYLSKNTNHKALINLDQTLEEIEYNVIQLVLEEENMNQSKVAKRLGINRSTLWRKIKMMEEKNKD